VNEVVGTPLISSVSSPFASGPTTLNAAATNCVVNVSAGSTSTMRALKTTLAPNSGSVPGAVTGWSSSQRLFTRAPPNVVM
jgi:hypothetical protein